MPPQEKEVEFWHPFLEEEPDGGSVASSPPRGGRTRINYYRVDPVEFLVQMGYSREAARRYVASYTSPTGVTTLP